MKKLAPILVAFAVALVSIAALSVHGGPVR